jgi:hypothetical protein
VTLASASLHFLVLPNWQERWCGLFYLFKGVCAATRLGLWSETLQYSLLRGRSVKRSKVKGEQAQASAVDSASKVDYWSRKTLAMLRSPD